MLVLSRKHGEQLLIGNSIMVTVVGIQSGRVRLGIEAPPDISVVRSELLPESLGFAVPEPEHADAELVRHLES